MIEFVQMLLVLFLIAGSGYVVGHALVHLVLLTIRAFYRGRR